MANKVESILDEIKGLTLLEASDLVKKMEEAFGVSAAAAAPGMMAGGAAGGAAPAEEKTEFTVVLTEVGANKINVIKAVREVTSLGATYFGTFTETSGTPITWRCEGQLLQWQGNHFYQNQECVYDPITNCVFANFSSGGATSKSGPKPNFNPQLGSITGENNGGSGNGPNWGNIGYVGGNSASPNCEVWLPTTSYTA